MTGPYRVRYTSGPIDRVRAADVVTADVSCELDDLRGALPAGSYVLSVEDLAARRDVHWTRWPDGLRPGSRDGTTGQVLK